MPSSSSSVVGVWRIDNMELWDRDYLDLDVPAHLTFDRDRLGSFQFGAVRGWIDYRVSTVGDSMRVEFSWGGFSASDASSGRAWAVVRAGQLEGRFFSTTAMMVRSSQREFRRALAMRSRSTRRLTIAEPDERSMDARRTTARASRRDGASLTSMTAPGLAVGEHSDCPPGWPVKRFRADPSAPVASRSLLS